MSALRLTSLGRSSRGSSTPHTFRSTPKVNNFRSFRYTPNVTTRIASPQRILEKATNNNLQTVKPSNLMTPKFYVSRPAQFHTTKLLKQDAKEQRAENGNGNHTTEETNQKTQDQTQSSDPKDAKIVELQNQIEEYKMKNYNILWPNEKICEEFVILMFRRQPIMAFKDLPNKF